MKRQLKNLIVPAYIIECNTRRQHLCADISDSDNCTAHNDINGIETLSNQSRCQKLHFLKQIFLVLLPPGRRISRFPGGRRAL